MNTVWNFIRKSGLKQGDMENGVDTSESVGKSEGKGMSSSFRKDPRNLLESLWDGRVVRKNLALTKSCSPMVKFRASDLLHRQGPDIGVGLRKLWI